MDTTCAHLRELDAWFSLSLDLLASEHDVRRDVLLLVGGGGTVEDVVAVTRDDCELVGRHLLAFPRAASGYSLPLTPGFVDVTGLRPGDWPDERRDPSADATAVENAIATVDAALARLTGVVRSGGAERLRELRMHSWLHELGNHVDVLARCYGPGLTELLRRSGSCPATRPDREISDTGASRRRARVDAVA